MWKKLSAQPPALHPKLSQGSSSPQETAKPSDPQPQAGLPQMWPLYPRKGRASGYSIPAARQQGRCGIVHRASPCSETQGTVSRPDSSERSQLRNNIQFWHHTLEKIKTKWRKLRR